MGLATGRSDRRKRAGGAPRPAPAVLLVLALSLAGCAEIERAGDWFGLGGKAPPPTPAPTQATPAVTAPPPPPPDQTRVIDIVLVDLPGGEFLMGEPVGAALEGMHWTRAAPFRLMRTEVTNREFGAFVETTGWVTDAERTEAGWVFSDGRWLTVRGAQWRTPRGPGSGLTGLADHPVVQVSQRDAEAFCSWAGLRLPRDSEWEYAARGADGRRFPWGNAPPRAPNQPIRANLGADHCCAAEAGDGYLFTAPVGVFTAGASPFGILDMAGNVQEWTASPVAGAPGRAVTRGGGWGADPDGLRVTLRHADPITVGTDMTGFRCAADPPGFPRRP